jgi:hypothetical protein
MSELDWRDVPAATPPAQCRTCHGRIFWIEAPSRAKGALNGVKVRVPVDCETIDGSFEPTAREVGRGVNHFQTCESAEQHRRPR